MQKPILKKKISREQSLAQEQQRQQEQQQQQRQQEHLQRQQEHHQQRQQINTSNEQVNIIINKSYIVYILIMSESNYRIFKNLSGSVSTKRQRRGTMVLWVRQEGHYEIVNEEGLWGKEEEKEGG